MQMLCSFETSVTDGPVTKRDILEEWVLQPLRLASHRTFVYAAVKLYLSVHARGRPNKFDG